MAGHRWLGVAGLGLVLCMGGCHPSDPQPAAPKAAASKASSPYPRCAKSKPDDTCVDLSDGLNPYEFEAKDYQAVTLPLLTNDHKATAIGLNGARSYLDDIMVGPGGELTAVGGAGLMVATNDGHGSTWHVAVHSPYANTLRGMARVDARTVFAVGDEADILRSQDAGTHWEAFNATFHDYKDSRRSDLLLGGDDRGIAYGVAFADASHGVIVGQAGVEHSVAPGILRTGDGGQDWQRVVLPQPLDGIALQKLAFADAHNGWSVGSQGTVLHTSDAGEHWQVTSLGDTQVHLMTLDFSTPTHGCMGGDLKVWCTWDAGKDWQAAKVELPKDMETDPDVGITALRLDTAGHGWMVTRGGQIFFSADEGRNWKLWMNIVDAAGKKLDGVEVWGLTLDHNHAWAVGMGSVAAPGSAQTSDSSDPLVVSWAW